jgi:hypothetical protein
MEIEDVRVQINTQIFDNGGFIDDIILIQPYCLKFEIRILVKGVLDGLPYGVSEREEDA